MEYGRKQTISDFEDLEVWQWAQKCAVETYELCKKFPDDEKFGLTIQLKRASSSISANIAEGFGRRSIADKKNFYVIAYGSLLETRNFFQLAHKLEFINENDIKNILPILQSTQKLLSRFISTTGNLK